MTAKAPKGAPKQKDAQKETSSGFGFGLGDINIGFPDFDPFGLHFGDGLEIMMGGIAEGIGGIAEAFE